MKSYTICTPFDRNWTRDLRDVMRSIGQQLVYVWAIYYAASGAPEQNN